MCAHHGYPLYPLPGGNVFLTAEDESTPDGAIECRQITEAQALRIAAEGARWLARLAEFF